MLKQELVEATSVHSLQITARCSLEPRLDLQLIGLSPDLCTDVNIVNLASNPGCEMKKVWARKAWVLGYV